MRSVVTTGEQRAEEGSQRFRQGHPATLKPEGLLVDAISTMLEDGKSGFPVVNSGDGMLCGIFTSHDVLRLFRVIMQIGSTVNG